MATGHHLGNIAENAALLQPDSACAGVPGRVRNSRHSCVRRKVANYVTFGRRHSAAVKA